MMAKKGAELPLIRVSEGVERAHYAQRGSRRFVSESPTEASPHWFSSNLSTPFVLGQWMLSGVWLPEEGPQSSSKCLKALEGLRVPEGHIKGQEETRWTTVKLSR